MNKHEIGMRGEDLACNYLEKNKCIILERNFRFKGGEIDIIAKDGEYFVFIEVKYRSLSAFGMASEAVNYPKQKKICRGCDFYRMKRGLGDFAPIRFDVIALDVNSATGKTQIQWIKNAFDYAR